MIQHDQFFQIRMQTDFFAHIQCERHLYCKLLLHLGVLKTPALLIVYRIELFFRGVILSLEKFVRWINFDYFRKNFKNN